MRIITITAAAAGAAALALTGAYPTTAEAKAHSPSPIAVLAWNQIAVQTGLAATQTNQEAMMRLAYVQAAVFDAVDALDGGYQPYAGQPACPRPDRRRRRGRRSRPPHPRHPVPQPAGHPGPRLRRCAGRHPRRAPQGPWHRTG